MEREEREELRLSRKPLKVVVETMLLKCWCYRNQWLCRVIEAYIRHSRFAGILLTTVIGTVAIVYGSEEVQVQYLPALLLRFSVVSQCCVFTVSDVAARSYRSSNRPIIVDS